MSFRLLRTACMLTVAAWFALVFTCLSIYGTENSPDCCWKHGLEGVSIFPIAEYLCPDEYGHALLQYQEYVQSKWPWTPLAKNQTILDLDCFDTRPRHPWCIPPQPWLEVLLSNACNTHMAFHMAPTECQECPAEEEPALIFRVWNMLVPLAAFFWFLFTSPVLYFYSAALVVSRVEIVLSGFLGLAVFGMLARIILDEIYDRPLVNSQ